MEYKLLWDMHTHTLYSHGKASIEENVSVAAEKGLLAIGIADHGPGHAFFGVNESEIPEMRKAVLRCKNAYPNLTVLLGTEANIVNRDGSLDLPKTEPLDFLIAGYHFGAFGKEPLSAALLCLANRLPKPSAEGWKKLRTWNTDRVLSSLYSNPIHILSHPGAKAPIDLRAVGAACKERGTMMELNEKHNSLNAEEIRMLRSLGVRFCIGSDAHRKEDVGRFEKALELARSAGLEPTEIANVVPVSHKPEKGDLPEWMS